MKEDTEYRLSFAGREKYRPIRAVGQPSRSRIFLPLAPKSSGTICQTMLPKTASACYRSCADRTAISHFMITSFITAFRGTSRSAKANGNCFSAAVLVAGVHRAKTKRKNRTCRRFNSTIYTTIQKKRRTCRLRSPKSSNNSPRPFAKRSSAAAQRRDPISLTTTTPSGGPDCLGQSLELALVTSRRFDVA